ncbi:capsular polysaccharide export protein, LipB/KpsS family [Pseudogemmobacter sp. W21_MBD1_M6]|uniref:capsular polysaccharide export protein, LipB/KpsS family n=1 Tax=Pseudogemmobacter sp. W21_MBD1_M6 TaxID=3240271 RepID=UPI003F998B6F
MTVVADTLSGKRIFLVGFHDNECEALLNEGIDCGAWIRDPHKGEKPFDAGVETHMHSDVRDVKLNSPAGIFLPHDLRDHILFNYFDMFRRHFTRNYLLEFSVLRSWNALDNVFHIAANFFYDVLLRQRITTVVFSNFPHEGSLIILYGLSKAMGLEVLICHQSPFPERFWIMKEIEDYGVFKTVNGCNQTIPLADAPEEPFYMKSNIKRELRIKYRKKLGKECLKFLFKLLAFTFIWNPKSLARSNVRINCASDQYKLISESAHNMSDFNRNEKFIYFPLSLQPEMTTDTIGLRFGDQLLALEELSAVLPEGMLIYAKENPKQTYHMRGESFYRRLNAMPNVRYLPADVPSFDLIKHSQCVAPVTGTAGWEALLMEKPVIHFGVTWYHDLPGVHQWQGAETLATALLFTPDRAKLAAAFDRLSRKSYTGMVDRGYAPLLAEYDPTHMARKTAASIVLALKETRQDAAAAPG